MKKIVTIIIWLTALALIKPVVTPLLPHQASATEKLGQLSVLESGRVKPLDSVARATLLLFRGKQTIRTDEGKISAMEWFEDLFFNRNAANKKPVFRIDHPHILALLGYEPGEKKYFSYDELAPWLVKVQEQARMVENDSAKRNSYERAVLQLFSNLVQYQKLTQTVYPLAEIGNVEGFYQECLGIESGEGTLKQWGTQMRIRILQDMAASPVHLILNDETWETPGDLLLKTNHDGAARELGMALAEMVSARQNAQPGKFAEAVSRFISHEKLLGDHSTLLEYYYNEAQLFIVALELNILAILLVLVAWQFRFGTLLKSAFGIVCIGFVLHTIGLTMRVIITGYAPVTNLYSSAVFVGWIAILLSLIFEIFQKKGIGTIAAATVGFLSLLVAHHLADNGDTMEKMRAVLNSNFWLSTHVITITMGYGATFLAGFLGIIYIIYGWLSRAMDEDLRNSFHRMLYASVAFALLFSFVGTVLGGIWADQSWGRFWGWDPKENGALMIVLWTSLILHALRGGMIETRGLVNLCILGNMVTAWSWFGTNMLGVGLHAYGFMDSAFFWLVIFWLSQMIIISLEWLFPIQFAKG